MLSGLSSLCLCIGGLGRRLLNGLLHSGWEVDIMDGTCRTFSDTFTTGLADIEIDICQIVLDGDSTEGTGLGTFATTYASGRAGLAGVATFLFVAAGDKDTTVLWSFVPKFDYATGTGFHTGSAGNALFLIDNRKTSFFVNSESVKLASFCTVTKTKAAECAATLTRIETVGESAILKSVIFSFHRGIGAGTVASDDGDLRERLSRGATQEGGDLFGNLVATCGTFKSIHIALFDKSLSHSTATGLSTTATVGAGQHFVNFVDQRIFNHFEFLCHNIEHHSENSTCDT